MGVLWLLVLGLVAHCHAGKAKKVPVAKKAATAKHPAKVKKARKAPWVTCQHSAATVRAQAKSGRKARKKP